MGNVSRKQALATVRAMTQPPNLSAEQWFGVKRFLEEIAKWYPNVYPGQERLARDMGRSVRTIKRYIRWAQEAKLLTVFPDQGVGVVSRTNVYHITELLEHGDTVSPTMGTRCPPIPGITNVTPVPDREPPVQKSSTSVPQVRSASGRPKVADVDKSRAEEIAAAAGERRVTKRPRQRDIDPSRRVANYFLDQWEQRVAMEIPALRKIRPAETIAQMTGYIRNTFLAPAAGRRHTEAEVCSYIDDFLTAVYTSSVIVKPKQSAFMRFTGWWGRTQPDEAKGSMREYFERRLTEQESAT